MRWRAAEEPATYATLAPGSGVSPQELVGWAVDFKRWLDLQATKSVPDPDMLVRFWAQEYREGEKPGWWNLAKALECHLGLRRSPHPHALEKWWGVRSNKYSESR
jgi:hypothetical protein